MERQSSLRNKQNLASEFCVVAREFSELRCLMNTLDYSRYTLNFDKHQSSTL